MMFLDSAMNHFLMCVSTRFFYSDTVVSIQGGEHNEFEVGV